MRIKNNILVTLVLFLGASISISLAQDPFFSQVNKNDTYLNPANSFIAIGDPTKVKFDLQYRDQWDNVGVGDNYTTSKVSVDYNFYKSVLDNWNAGLLFLSDRSNAGYLKQTAFQMFTAYTRKLSGSGRGQSYSSMVTVGSSFGLNQTNVDISNLWFGRQYDLANLSVDPNIDSGENPIANNASYIDINIGGKYTQFMADKSYYSAGLSLHHINRPQLNEMNTDITMAPRLGVQLEALLPLGNSLYHKPGLTFVQQDWSYQIIPSYLLSFDLSHPDEEFTLVSGVSARVVNGLDATILDAAIIHLGISSTKWHLNFSFDINTSTLRPATNGIGALELGLGYNIVSN